jgi:hypothetical protein
MKISLASNPTLRRLLTAALLICPSLPLLAATDGTKLEVWQNPALVSSGTLAPHASMIICPDARTARRIEFVGNAERVKSPFYRSLNGGWKYRIF